MTAVREAGQRAEIRRPYHGMKPARCQNLEPASGAESHHPEYAVEGRISALQISLLHGDFCALLPALAGCGQSESVHRQIRAGNRKARPAIRFGYRGRTPGKERQILCLAI